MFVDYIAEESLRSRGSTAETKLCLKLNHRKQHAQIVAVNGSA